MLALLAPLVAATMSSWTGEPEPAPREACPAASLWASMTEEIPDAQQNGRLHARIASGLEMAQQADADLDELTAASRCLESVLDYSDAASTYYGNERAITELGRADAEADALRSRIRALSTVIPPVPPPTAQEQWERRHRRLVGHTTVSAVFTTGALLAATMPWVHLAASCHPGELCGDAGVIGAFVTTWVAVPVGLIAGVSLGIWASRLARHRRMPPPGLTWPGREVRLTPTGGGLRLSF